MLCLVGRQERVGVQKSVPVDTATLFGRAVASVAQRLSQPGAAPDGESSLTRTCRLTAQKLVTLTLG